MSLVQDATTGDKPSSANVNQYHFDSNASPEQKKQTALQAAPAGLKTQKRNRGEEIFSDAGLQPTIEMPLPTARGATVQEHETKAQGLGDQKGSIIGWEMAGGSTREEYAKFLQDEEETHGSIKLDDRRGANHVTSLESILPDSAYGDWYHNTGIIAFCALTCWVVGRVGGGLAWIILLGATCATYYRTSIRRVRRNVRDDMTRQVAKIKLETDTESAEWMNSFLTKFWIIYEPVLSASIVASVDQILATTTPSFLESMRLAFFTLGTKPPRIESVKTYPKTEDDIVLMDWRFSFTPNDTDDLTARQLKNKINPKIELAIRAGVSVAAVNIPILVEDIAFSGLMQVRIKLMTEFPHVKVVDLSFLQKPSIGYVLKPIGGSSLGFDIGFIPGLSGWILEMIHASLAPMMYSPNVFTLNIQQMMSGAPIDSAVGVATITIHSCHGLRNPEIGSGKPDPYVTLSVGRGELARTRTIKSDPEPRFNETKTLLLTTLTDSLTLEVFDFNEVRKDKSLGLATFDLTSLETDSEQEHISVPIVSTGKSRGNIVFSVSWSPVLAPPKLEDGSLGPVPESKAGIVRFTVHQAKNLDGGKSCSPYAILTANSTEIARSIKMKHTHNPVWDFAKEILVTDRNACVLGVQVKNEDFGSDSMLGAFSIRLTDLLKNNLDEIDDYVLKQATSPNAKVKLTAVWKPIATNGLGSSAVYVAPIGTLRFHCKRAIDLRNPELGLTGGKADPYMRVLVGGQQRGRTVTIKNEQNPIWDEIIYVPIKTRREMVVLEVMDHQSRTRDRSLGQVQVETSSFIQQDHEGSYLAFVANDEKSSALQGKDAKGSILYSVSFYPTTNVAALGDEQQIPEMPEGSTNDPENHDPDTPTLFGSGRSQASHTRTFSTTTAQSQKSLVRPAAVQVTKEELMRHNSGYLVFELLEGQLMESGCYLQILFDDYLYPAYTTSKARSRHAQWNETGEGFIRELDASTITIRVNREADSHEENHIVAQAQDQTLNVLRRSYNEVVSQTLKSKDGSLSTISFRCRYYPVAMELDPRESVTNMGTLRVSVVSGHKLCAADRGNKSDPYAKFYVSTQQEHVYKTETIKKTLNPEWNESFECEISSRLDNHLRVEVYDWDAVGEDDHLGTAEILLANLEPMSQQDLTVALIGPKGGNGKSGTVNLRLLFRPNFVTRSKRGTTTRAFTIAAGVGGAPIKVVGAGFSGIKKTGSFVGRGMGFAKRRASRDEGPDIVTTTDGRTIVQDGDPPNSILNMVGDLEAAGPSQDSVVVGGGSVPSQRMPSANGSAVSHNHQTSSVSHGETVDMTLHLLRGTDFPDKKTVLRIRTRSGQSLGKTDTLRHTDPAIDTEFRISVQATEMLEAVLLEHSTFGTDKVIATAKFVVSGQSSTREVVVGFDTGAKLYLEWRSAPASNNNDATSLKSHRGMKLGSPFRKLASQRE